MFDNPNEELKRLEEQLLKAEETDAEFDRFYDEVYDEYGIQDVDFDDVEDLLADTPVEVVRNYANGYGDEDETPVWSEPVRQEAPHQYDAPQRPVQQRPVQRPAQQRPVQQRPQNPNRPVHDDGSRYAAPVKKEKGVRGLVITACIECAGIVALVLWWVMRIL